MRICPRYTSKTPLSIIKRIALNLREYESSVELIVHITGAFEYNSRAYDEHSNINYTWYKTR